VIVALALLKPMTPPATVVPATVPVSVTLPEE